MMHWGNFGGMGYGGFGLGWIFMVLFWTLIILGIVFILKQLRGGSGETVRRESAEEVLKKRYAAGEITGDEYKEKIRIISNGS